MKHKYFTRYYAVYFTITLVPTHKLTACPNLASFPPNVQKIDKLIIAPDVNATFFLLPPQDEPQLSAWKFVNKHFAPTQPWQFSSSGDPKKIYASAWILCNKLLVWLNKAAAVTRSTQIHGELNFNRNLDDCDLSERASRRASLADL